MKKFLKYLYIFFYILFPLRWIRIRDLNSDYGSKKDIESGNESGSTTLLAWLHGPEE
jgi:hypothetical protein